MPLRDDFKRRIYTYPEFSRVLAGLLQGRVLKRAGSLDASFRERLMLAVTEVNGCPYCSYLHARLALSSGMEDTEVRALLSGDLEAAPDGQLAALMFAQHWAETHGVPSADAVEALVETYGREHAGDIIAAVRSIMLGNLYGNTLDALRWKLRGRPVPAVGLLEIIGVLLGGVWIVPRVFLIMLWERLRGQRILEHPVDTARRHAVTESASPGPHSLTSPG